MLGGSDRSGKEESEMKIQGFSVYEGLIHYLHWKLLTRQFSNNFGIYVFILFVLCTHTSYYIISNFHLTIILTRLCFSWKQRMWIIHSDFLETWLTHTMWIYGGQRINNMAVHLAHPASEAIFRLWNLSHWMRLGWHQRLSDLQKVEMLNICFHSFPCVLGPDSWSGTLPEAASKKNTAWRISAQMQGAVGISFSQLPFLCQINSEVWFQIKFWLPRLLSCSMNYPRSFYELPFCFKKKKNPYLALLLGMKNLHQCNAP